jgi:hypothetical protein
MNLSTTRVRFRALTQVVLATMLVLISISGLKAQTTKRGLVGMVVDATGAVVPSATVTIINPGTSLSRDQQTRSMMLSERQGCLEPLSEE